MAESIVEFFRKIIGNDQITIFIVSMIPFVEVRGSIPLAIKMGINVYETFALAFCGSVLVCPILLLILRPIIDWLKKFKLFRALVEAIEDGFKGKAKKVTDGTEGFDASIIERKKMLGLYAFVALPVPMTGVWTGSAVGAFLDLSFIKSLIIVIVGDLTACLLMSLLSYFCAAYIDIILYIVFAIVVVAIMLFITKIIVKAYKKGKENAN